MIPHHRWTPTGAGTPGPDSPCIMCNEPREAPVHQKPDGWARMAAEVLLNPSSSNPYFGIYLQGRRWETYA